MTWVRFERHRRYHAVYAAALGGWFFYCGRFVRQRLHDPEAIELTETPPFRCLCCKTRVHLPYLVPRELHALRAETIDLQKEQHP